MRFHRPTRLLALGMWGVVAAIAVTGFAAFDPEPEAQPPAPPTVTGRQDVVGIAPSALFDFAAVARPWSDPPIPDPVPPTTLPPAPATSTSADTKDPTPTTAPPAAPPTTTTSTTTTTLPRGPGPASTVHPAAVEAWRPLVEAFFPESETDRALDVIWCESRGRAGATHPTSGAAGLFQHLPKYWAERSVPAGFAGADIYDPEANVGVAAWLVAVDGWKHWFPSLHCWG